MTTHQSATFTEKPEEKSEPVLSRRSLLRQTAIASIGCATFGLEDNSVASTNDSIVLSNISENPLERPDTNNQRFDRALRVKATGTGINEYRIEASRNIIPSTGVDGQQTQSCNSAVEGSLEQGRSNLYYLTGRIMNVFSRGSITYYVRE